MALSSWMSRWPNWASIRGNSTSRIVSLILLYLRRVSVTYAANQLLLKYHCCVTASCLVWQTLLKTLMLLKALMSSSQENLNLQSKFNVFRV